MANKKNIFHSALLFAFFFAVSTCNAFENELEIMFNAGPFILHIDIQAENPPPLYQPLSLKKLCAGTLLSDETKRNDLLSPDGTQSPYDGQIPNDLFCFLKKQRMHATEQLEAALKCPGGDANWHNNRLAIMRAIRQGSDTEINYNSYVKDTALCYAALQKDLKLVQLCLKHGACIDTVDNQSAIKSRLVLELLIEHGYDVNRHQNNTDLPLNWAMRLNNKPTITACLIEHGASPTLQEQGSDNTALQVLARTANEYIGDYINKENELEEKCRLILWHPHVTLADLKKRDRHNRTLEEQAGDDTPGKRLFIGLLTQRRAELEENALSS